MDQPGDIHTEQVKAEQVNFEKIKYGVELIKWFIGSVVIVIMTLIINSGFKDREAGLLEIQQYDKYVTELIVLNKEVGPRRLLAQYFSNVTASEKLRLRWKEYYVQVEAEYKDFLKQDSVIKGKIDSLQTKDSVKLSIYEKREIQDLQLKKNNIDRQINSPLRLPENKGAGNPGPVSAVACHFLFYDKAGLPLIGTIEAVIVPYLTADFKGGKNYTFDITDAGREPVYLLPGFYKIRSEFKGKTYINKIEVTGDFTISHIPVIIDTKDNP